MLITFQQLQMTRTSWKLAETDINPDHIVSLDEYEYRGLFGGPNEILELDPNILFTEATLTNGDRKILVGSRQQIQTKMKKNLLLG